MGQPRRTDSAPGPVVLTDPRAIRALAHPARLAILEALFEGQELTATECAHLTGLSPSATAYHLKALERWGIVRPGTPRNDARERPWTACGISLEVDSSAPDRSSLAEKAFLNLALNRDRQAVFRVLDRGSREPKAWRDVVTLHSRTYRLAAAEVAELISVLERAIAAHGVDHAKGEASSGARRVRISLLTVPDDEGASSEPGGP